MAPPNRRPDNAPQVPKPYEFVEFPPNAPTLTSPAGHHKYLKNRIHGILHLQLTVETALHISTGTVMMGRDLGQSKIPLIKTMQTGNEKLTIPGSSLKGVVRSIYEAITNSTLAVVTNRYKDKMPRNRLPCRSKEKLCPASRVFGALDWQGLISFQDARCVKKDLHRVLCLPYTVPVPTNGANILTRYLGSFIITLLKQWREGKKAFLLSKPPHNIPLRLNCNL